MNPDDPWDMTTCPGCHAPVPSLPDPQAVITWQETHDCHPVAADVAA